MVGSSLENTLEPKTDYRVHYHCKWTQSFGLCKGRGQLWPPGLWTCESYSLFAFWRAPALLTQAALRDLINCLLATAEWGCSCILAGPDRRAAKHFRPFPCSTHGCFLLQITLYWPTSRLCISSVLIHDHIHPLFIQHRPFSPTIPTPILICCLSLASLAP